MAMVPERLTVSENLIMAFELLERNHFTELSGFILISAHFDFLKKKMDL